jgi:hypothetical protein
VFQHWNKLICAFKKYIFHVNIIDQHMIYGNITVMRIHVTVANGRTMTAHTASGGALVKPEPPGARGLRHLTITSRLAVQIITNAER